MKASRNAPESHLITTDSINPGGVIYLRNLVALACHERPGAELLAGGQIEVYEGLDNMMKVIICNYLDRPSGGRFVLRLENVPDEDINLLVNAVFWFEELEALHEGTRPASEGIPRLENVKEAWECLRQKGFNCYHGENSPLRVFLVPRSSPEQQYARIYRDINLMLLFARDRGEPPVTASFLHEVGHFMFRGPMEKDFKENMVKMFPDYRERYLHLEETACDIFAFAMMGSGNGFLEKSEERNLGAFLGLCREFYPFYFLQ